MSDQRLSRGYADLLAGRMVRRDFLQLALACGLSAASANSMAGESPVGESGVIDTGSKRPTTATRPNVLLILADDMGFGDLGIMGSEIRTPNIDSIARNGTLFTSMYNAARCCPTRAALLTGLYPHRAGIGHMGTDLGTPAYRGFLREDAATIAEMMKASGYRTLMAGKWHVGGDLWATRVASWRLGDADRPTPLQRGFDRFYGMVDGVMHYFSPWYIQDDDQPAQLPNDGFYLTDAITDKAIGMLEESTQKQQPFFMYLAHHAPHWPLHALPDDIARYAGHYAGGWDALRGARYEEMLQRGVLQHAWSLSARDSGALAWSDAPHRTWEAARMAVYAAQIDRMDQQIGRVITALKRLGQYENTLILFFSDNGGCAEAMREGGWTQFYPDTTRDGRKVVLGNQPGLEPGGPQTFMSYDLPWANASNTPFRLFKHFMHEGGISTPMAVQWPRAIRPGGINHSACHVVDVLPTILDATGVRAPSEFKGSVSPTLDGKSLLPLLQGAAFTRERPIYWEHEGNCAVRDGQWKLVRKFGGAWELYDMERDRTELTDLASANATVAKRLAAGHAQWAQEIGVVDWAIQQPKLMKAWNMEDIRG